MSNQIFTAENIKSGALALVVLLGGGNLWQSNSNEKDIDKAIGEIHDLHGDYNKSVDRQKRLEDMLKQLTGKTP